jgi:hypothetical protein
MMSNHKVSANATQHDHDGLYTSQVYFSLRDDELVVRAQCNQTNDILALIPSRKLRGDLPPVLVDGHVHWLNLSTKIIEIRPLERLWEQSSENWRIDCGSGQYRTYRGSETLVDIRSPTWAMVSKCFQCLNDIDDSSWDRNSDEEDSQSQSRNLLITTSLINSVQSTSIQRLSVTLPRYGLSFFVNEREELESRDFKDMVYDEDQCVGALFGLENLLVLRQKIYIAGTLIPKALIPRRVLVPNGFPKTHGNHQVRIDIAQSTTLGYLVQLAFGGPLCHTYDVDTELGCLIGNGGLTSTRYLAYLHAMTSCHRPDPLTGKMGTQAALCLLQSAECRSIIKLKALDDDPLWTSTQYPQINAAHKEIQKRYYWDRDSRWHIEAARRAAYQFPSNAAEPLATSLLDYDTKSKCVTTRVPAEPGLPTSPHSISFFNQCLPRHISLDQLLCSRPAPELPARSALLRDSRNISSDDIPLLDQLFSSLRADSSFQREYLAHLGTSVQFVHAESQMTCQVASENLIGALEQHYVLCRLNYQDSLDILKKRLGPTTDPHEQALDRSGQWPPMTADVLLRYLASASPIDIPPHWKKCLTSLALLLLELQRSRRLLRCALDGLEEEFSEELENEGCDGWNAEEYPDWLLIQVDFFCSNARLY